MSWEKVNLNELCEINVGKTPSRAILKYFGTGTEWVSIADMNNKTILNETKEHVTLEGIKSANMKPVPEGTVLLSFKLSVGKVCITGKPMYTNEAIAALPITDKNKIDTKFLYYAMKSQDFSHLGERAAKGLTLNKEKLNRIELLVPNMRTQQRIAAILNKADELRKKDQQLLAKYDELLQSIFYDMFGDPLSNDRDWKMKRLEEVTKKITDGKHGDCIDEANSGYYFISAKDLKDGKISYNSVREITKLDFEETDRRTRLQLDDILIGNTGASIGKIAFAENADKVRKTTFQKSIAIVTVDKDFLIPRFLFAFLLANSFVLERISSGSGQKNLLLSQLRDFKVPIPSIPLQNKFASIAQNIQQQKQQIKNQIAQSENLFQVLLQKAFKGELVA